MNPLRLAQWSAGCIAQFGAIDGVRRCARAYYYRFRHGVALHYSDAIGLLEHPVDAWPSQLPHAEQHDLVLPRLPEANRRLEEDKLLFATRCARASIAHPPTLAVIGTGVAARAPAGSELIETPAQMAAFAARNDGLVCICKPIGGGLGYGVHALRVASGQVLAQGTAYTPEGYFEHLRALPYAEFAWQVQARVGVHPALTDLMPGPGVGTVRIISLLEQGGTVSLHWPVLKIPAPGNVVDNWRLGTNGATVVAIDLASGRLARARGRPAGRACCAWLDAIGSPPVQVSGRVLPQWPELCALVERGARAFPELPMLGWDVAITPDGPSAIEANWDFTITLQSACFERGLRDAFMALLPRMRTPAPAAE